MDKLFNILIVEDVEETLDAVTDLIQMAIPEAEVTTASYVREAHEKIDKASEANKPFNAAVLDFKLPYMPGNNPEIDETICNRLNRTTHVVHITGYVDDTKVLKHMAERHTGSDNPTGDRFDKSDIEYANKIIANLRKNLYSPYVGHLIDDTVRQRRYSGDVQFGRRYGRDTEGDAAYGDRQTTLVQAVLSYWPYLDHTTRGRVENLFVLEKSADEQRVRVLGTAAFVDGSEQEG